MLESLKAEASITYTENDAVTYSTTGSDCLDFFSSAGAIRGEDESEIIKRFMRAFAEDKDMAVKILFYTRDIREGLGERRVFRICLKWLAENHPDSVKKNMAYIAVYGRYDDLFELLGTRCETDMMEFVKRQFDEDMDAVTKEKSVSLLGKWLPSVNTSSSETRKKALRVAEYLRMGPAAYRRALTVLRSKIKILENNLRTRDYTFDYSEQPSRAMFKYKKAFIRNDGERYRAYLGKVSRGDAILHADNVSPYELIGPYLNNLYSNSLSNEEKQSLNVTWNSLPDYGNDEDVLAVVDNSGSMYMSGRPVPATVALSLGLYLAEHNRGAYRNHFITFSETPQLIEIKGDDLVERISYIASFSEVANTNIDAVFELILQTAVKNNLPQEQLPRRIIIISDMEFDEATSFPGETNYQNARENYAEAGYKLPDVVFWNVASRHSHQPVRKNEEGVILVSGCTPKLFSMVAGGHLSPYSFMMEVIKSERYARITA